MMSGIQKRKKQKKTLVDLRNLLYSESFVTFNSNDEGKIFNFKLAYNPSYGMIDDIFETFWQLKENGQISEGFFGAVYAALTWEESTSLYDQRRLNLLRLRDEHTFKKLVYVSVQNGIDVGEGLSASGLFDLPVK